jgi:hypothetical protein
MPLARLSWCAKTGTSQDLQRPKSGGELKPEPPRLEELNYLYDKLSADERDELLQCLLIAAPRGGETMVKVLEGVLLCHATEELLKEPPS